MDFKKSRALCCLFCLWLICNFNAQNNIDSLCSKRRCNCTNNLSPAGLMFSSIHPAKEWMIAYRDMSMHMQGLLNEDKIISSNEILSTYPSSPKQMQMNMHMLMVMYGLNDWLTVMFMGDYQTKDMIMQMQIGDKIHQHGMYSKGIGDASLYAMFALHKKNNLIITALTGISLPTGNIRIKATEGSMMYGGQRLPYQMQTGSGSIGILSGISFLYQSQNTAVGTQVNAVIRPFYNTLRYNLGNNINHQIWLAQQVSKLLQASIRVESSYSDRIKGEDISLAKHIDPSANHQYYGGTSVKSFIGISIQGLKKFNHTKLALEYGMPLLQKLNGIQMSTKQILLFNVSTNF